MISQLNSMILNKEMCIISFPRVIKNCLPALLLSEFKPQIVGLTERLSKTQIMQNLPCVLLEWRKEKRLRAGAISESVRTVCVIARMLGAEGGTCHSFCVCLLLSKLQSP